MMSKADISGRRWSIDPTRMTQSGHGQPNFAVMHNWLFNRP